MPIQIGEPQLKEFKLLLFRITKRIACTIQFPSWNSSPNNEALCPQTSHSPSPKILSVKFYYGRESQLNVFCPRVLLPNTPFRPEFYSSFLVEKSFDAFDLDTLIFSRFTSENLHFDTCFSRNSRLWVLQMKNMQMHVFFLVLFSSAYPNTFSFHKITCKTSPT